MLNKLRYLLNNMTALEFTTALSHERSHLRSYAYQLTKNIEDANDLTQETMLKAITHREKFVDATNLKGWLFTIMKNSFINNYRRMMKRNTFIDSTDNTYYLDTPALSVPNHGESKFVMRDLEDAVAKLPEELYKTFTLNFTGYKYHEIAEMLHIPIGTVKTRIFTARKQLRERLKGYGEMYGLAYEK